jgi:hypothetical protein
VAVAGPLFTKRTVNVHEALQSGAKTVRNQREMQRRHQLQQDQAARNEARQRGAHGLR